MTAKFSILNDSVAHLKWDKFIPLNYQSRLRFVCPVMVWFCAFPLHDNQKAPRPPHRSFGSIPRSHPLVLLVLRLVSSDDHHLGVSVYCCCYAVLGGWAFLALIMGVFGDETSVLLLLLKQSLNKTPLSVAPERRPVACPVACPLARPLACPLACPLTTPPTRNPGKRSTSENFRGVFKTCPLATPQKDPKTVPRTTVLTY